MPPSEEASFNRALVEDFASIMTSLSKIDTENASASVQQDQDTIKRLVREGMGFTAVNKAVMGVLHEWLGAAGRAALELEPNRGTSKLINQLAMLYEAQGKLEEAEPLYIEALGANRATLGDRHPDTLIRINNLGALYQAQGKLEEAEPLFIESVDAHRATLGDRHPSTLIAINNLGLLYQDQGKLDQAEPLMIEALDASRATLGDRHPDTLG